MIKGQGNNLSKNFKVYVFVSIVYNVITTHFKCSSRPKRQVVKYGQVFK